MSQDLLLITGFLTVFALLSISVVPSLITKWKASSIGLNLTLREAHLITKHHCNKINFLLAVRDIWFWEHVALGELTSTYLIKQNLENLKNGIIAMKQRNQPINISVLRSFDLAGRDLMEEIKKAEIRNWQFILD